MLFLPFAKRRRDKNIYFFQFLTRPVELEKKNRSVIPPVTRVTALNGCDPTTSVVLLLLHDLKRAFTSFTNLLVFLKCNYDLLTSLVYRVIHIYSAHQSHSDLKCSIFYFRIEFAGIQTHYQLSCCG